jgi:hypothetical protein
MIAALLLASPLLCFAAAKNASSAIQVETLIQSTSSWDGTREAVYLLVHGPRSRVIHAVS